MNIARALASEAPILVLDDSASALDNITEAALRKALKGLDRTLFVVSQRTQNVRDADVILVLDDGAAVGYAISRFSAAR